MKNMFELLTASVNEVQIAKKSLQDMAYDYEREGQLGLSEELRKISNSLEFVDMKLADIIKVTKGVPESINTMKEV